jgi:hypothetical protein
MHGTCPLNKPPILLCLYGVGYSPFSEEGVGSDSTRIFYCAGADSFRELFVAPPGGMVLKPSIRRRSRTIISEAPHTDPPHVCSYHHLPSSITQFVMFGQPQVEIRRY